LAAESLVWLVIGKGFATLRELETEWSVDDLFRAAACIEMQSDIEVELAEQAKRKTAKG